MAKRRDAPTGPWARGRVLHFVRHGQYHTEAGPKEGTLTSLGRRQARLLARHFNELDINTIISSDLPRAVETASILAGELQLRHSKQLGLLREVMPSKVRGVVVPVRKRLDARQRIDDIFAQLFQPSSRTRHEIVVCHGNLIRSLVCRLIGAAPVMFQRFMTHNAGVTTFLVSPKGAQLVSYNVMRHLPLSLQTKM